MLKFWLALILGTIGISAGLTYLKLHRGAQMIEYPPPAPKAKKPSIEFLPVRPDTEKSRMEISANLVLFHVKDAVADVENEVAFKIKNNGEGTLELSYKDKTCTCADIYIDNQRISGTSHNTKLESGQSALVKLVFKPKYDAQKANEKTRIRATFVHNDERYSDYLQFEIVTTVKPG